VPARTQQPLGALPDRLSEPRVGEGALWLSFPPACLLIPWRFRATSRPPKAPPHRSPYPRPKALSHHPHQKRCMGIPSKSVSELPPKSPLDASASPPGPCPLFDL
jgi:hypothetical protein